jgi:hypothetical protein
MQRIRRSIPQALRRNESCSSYVILDGLACLMTRVAPVKAAVTFLYNFSSPTLGQDSTITVSYCLAQSNTLQGPLQDPTTTITMFAPINDAFERLAFTQPLYSCTNLACLLISNPEVCWPFQIDQH